MKINLNSKSKKRIILSGLSIAIVTLIVAIALFSVQENKINKTTTNPELARAMEYGELTEKDEETQSEYVRFSTYFARDLNGDGYAEKVKGTCKEVEGEDTLYMSLNVLGNGYLENGKIEIQSNNMYFKTALVNDETIDGNYISENTKSIDLKDVYAGTQKLIFGQVRTGDYRYLSTKKDAIGKDTNKYSGINKIILTGTHVKNDGTRTEIKKEVEIPVDWYSTTKAEIPYTYGVNSEKNKYQNYSTESIVDEEKQEVNLEFKIVTQESNNKLLLSKSTIQGTIPELNGYKATKIEITGENVEYTYNEETGEYLAYRTAQVGEDGVVTKEAYTSSWNMARYSEFKLKVTYPLEAYEKINETIILNIPVKATFEGYNNNNDEFDNPYVSNVAEDIISLTYERGGGDVITVDVNVGTKLAYPYDTYVVSKENAVKYYNNDETKDNNTYEVRWYVSRGNSGTIEHVKLKEQDNNYTDKFLTTENQYEDMLKYSKNIGIYFTTPGAMFGEKGWIKLYNDETDELIHEFTSKDWEKYSKENPYYYEEPVDHIRIETSKADRTSSFTAISIKELNNEQLTTDKTREEFDKLSKINSYLTGYAKFDYEDDYTKVKDDVGIANYDEPLSIARINNITPSTYSTQGTTNVKIQIGTVNLGYNVKLWKNGIFVLKLPKEILMAEINEISINNSNVGVLGYDVYEENEQCFIKILTENIESEDFIITIDCNITPNPRTLSAVRSVELYAYNEECNNYKDNFRKQDEFDINGNENKNELVNYDKINIDLVGPTSLITTETGSDYNDTGDELKTTVAPQVAIIDKTQQNKTAKISVQIINNYSGNISGVILVGKTPFKGNSSQILGKDLGSTFTAGMTGPIELPEKLQGIATVYYSENENVNNNINDSSNNWKTEEEVTDFSKIRTYAIELGDYQIQKGEEYICTYEIKVPEDVNYNDVTYSTHAVYFYLETDEGRLKDQTETNKLGFMIAKKYNLELTKYQTSSDFLVKNATYKVAEEGKDNSRIATTNSEGKLKIEDLYAERTYVIQEIKSPEGYKLNDNKIKIYTKVNDEGKLEVQKLEGETKEDIIIDENNSVKISVEDEPLSNLNIVKEDKEGKKLEDIRFEITGKGYTNRVMITNSKGIATISGLYPNEEYTIKEVKADGYYIPEGEIKFKIENTNNKYELKIIEDNLGILDLTTGKTENNLPSFEIKLQNEKIPTYNIEILKVDKNNNNPLKNAQFALKSLDDGEENYYSTNDKGVIEINDLYQYVDGKYILGEYELKELVAPEGYITDTNVYKFRCINKNGTLELEFLNENKFDYTVENGKIKITMKNAPIFKLVKRDGETQEPLPNTKFVIYKIDEEYNEYPAYDVNGELVGESIEIQGENYQVITTDENGEISINLPKGLYKVIEVQALEDYELPENIEERTYYFGIDETVQATREWTSEDFYVDINARIAVSENGDIISGNNEYKEVNGKNVSYLNICRIDNESLNTKWNFLIGGKEEGTYPEEFIYGNEENIIVAVRTYDTELYIYNKNGTEQAIIDTELNNDEFHIVLLKIDGEGNYLNSIVLDTESNNTNPNFFISDIDEEGNFVIDLYTTDKSPRVNGKYTSSGEDLTIQIKQESNTIFYINKDMKVEWMFALDRPRYNFISGAEINKNDNILVAYEYSMSFTIPKEQTINNEEINITTEGKRNVLIIELNKQGLIINHHTMGDKYDDIPRSIHATEDNGYILMGYSNGELTIPAKDTVKNEEIILNNSNSNQTGWIIKYTKDNMVEWAINIENIELYTDAIEFDNKYVVVGDIAFKEQVIIPAELTENKKEIVVEAKKTGKNISLMINEKGKIVYAFEGQGSGKNEEIEGFKDEIFVSSGYSNLTKIYQKVVLPEVPQIQEINVDNYKKKFNIWTYVNGYGGNISGEFEDPYEQVKIHEDSAKEIVITPDEGYGIASIEVNGEKIPYTTNEDGTVILDKFKDMTEDKEVVVTFIPKEYLYTINKVDETGKKLPGAEFEIKKPITDDPSIGENAIGEMIPAGEYSFEKNGEKYIPNNLNIDNSMAISYILLDLSNAKDSYKITLNAEVSIGADDEAVAILSTDSMNDQQDIFYLSGTHDTKDYSTTVQGGQQYILLLGYANQDSTTEDNFVVNSIKVEQTDFVQNITTDANGQAKVPLEQGDYILKETKAPEGYVLNEEEIPITIGGEETSINIVNKENSKVLVHHYKDGTTEKLAEDELLTGAMGDNYTTAPKTDIEGYEVVMEKLPSNASGQYTKDIQEVIYYYKEIPAKLIVNYYIEGTTEVVPGTESEQRAEIAEKGESYETAPAINADPKYELVAVPSNSNGVIEGTETVVTYYYRVKDSAGVIVHHIDTETKEKIASDVVIPANGTAKYGDEYTTTTSDEIPANYEYVTRTDNWEGTMIDKLTEVTYEYRKVNPNIINQDINKTATTKVDALDSEIEYGIEYSTEIENYIGKAQITIVDTLPYAIDVSKSTLNGGTYDPQTKTITWKELIDGIDTYAKPESGNIQINKNIKVVYTNIDTTKTEIENKVTGKVKLLDTNTTSEEIEAKAVTTTGFTVNIPVSKVWDDESNKLGKRPESVIFKLTGSDGSEYTKELTIPGTEGSTTTQDSNNANKWNDIFENLPKYDADNKEITYTLTSEEEKTEGDLKYYDIWVDTENNIITNTSKYGKVTVHYYIMNSDGTPTTNRVPDINGTEIQDVLIEGKEGDEYRTEPAENVSDKYELVEEKLPANAEGTIEKYNEEEPQEVIYYYRLKPAKVIINYLEKDGDTDDSNNAILSEQEQIDGYVDDKYNTDTDHRKETLVKDGKTYTLVEDSKNTEGTMTVEDINVTYYYLQNTKATVRYVERDPISHEIIRDLEEPRTEEGLVGDEFVTTEKAFTGYRLVEAPKDKTIQMTKEEQTLIYYYEPITTGLVENHIDDITGEVLYTETHNVQVGQDYNIPNKEFAGYDLIESKLPNNSTGTMGEELVTVNYYYIKKAVLEVNYIDRATGEPLADQIVDETKHEGDSYTTVEKTFEGYELIEEPENATGTMEVEVDADGNIVNNRTVVTYYYGKPAEVEEHHIDILTKEELEEPTIHKGYVGEEYNIPWKEFLSYVVAVDDGQGNNMLPENSTGKYTEEKQVVTYYYYQPAKVIVHYVDKTTGKEIQETNEETGKLQSSQVVIEGSNQAEYKTEAKEFPYYTLVQRPEKEEGKMKVEITKDENGKDIVNNTIDVYYYYEPKSFNIGVDKTISKVTVDGEEQNISNNKLTRVEIYRKNVNETKVEVEYTIKVTNNEEVDGKAIIRENIPDGMSVADNDGTWDEKDRYLEKVITDIKAGETKEYKITLAWDGGDKNLGEKNNKVEITQTDNIPGFKDNNDQDNSSEARVLINVSTGSIPWPLVIGLLALVGLEGVTLSYARILTNKQKKNRK